MNSVREDNETRLLRRVAELEDELEAANTRLRDLETTVFREHPVPLSLKLTRNESRILGLLLARDVVSRDLIMLALYSGDYRRDPPEPKIVDVFMSNVRKKLAAVTVTVQTIWGTGWALTREDKDRILGLSEEPARMVAA